VRSLQHFISQSPWCREGLLKIHQSMVVETLGAENGVILVDESGMVKQGEHSVGVARQWCGSVGKVANSQVGVYLGYASPKGHSFLDARLYLPEEWFEDTLQSLRQVCGVPEELVYQTKPEIGLELLKNALERGELPWPMGGSGTVFVRWELRTEHLMLPMYFFRNRLFSAGSGVVQLLR
jgi:SRSO17 transposase